MLYLLDANVLIDANRDYYPIVRIPEFWAWLVHVGQTSDVNIPVEMYEEITDLAELGAWLKDDETEMALKLDQECDPLLVAQVIELGYANDLTDDELENIGRDPFLVAYALTAKAEICVVSTEVSKPGRQRANRHLPDVCSTMEVPCCNTFEFVRRLDFSTNWQNP